jgi:methionyl-tRNA synthetase
MRATATRTATTEEARTLTLRLGENFHRRLKAKLLADSTNFQAKVQAMLQEYVDGPVGDREEITRQVAAAREAMRRYAPAMRELAR